MCAGVSLNPDIPALLAKKNPISTNYISGYYYGDIPFEKINDPEKSGSERRRIADR
ncbi:MAG: hypothetical protein R2860_15270 [Desulfobacterales bacterium]